MFKGKRPVTSKMGALVPSIYIQVFKYLPPDKTMITLINLNKTFRAEFSKQNYFFFM